MIYIGNLCFNENEIINKDDILRCHPQNMPTEKIGIPLRACAGMQIMYDKNDMEYLGATFYIPITQKEWERPNEHIKYVLACEDGNFKGDTLYVGDIIYVYSNCNITRSTGHVKRGQILGTVGAIPDGYGYGVTVTAFSKNHPGVYKYYDKIYNIPKL